TSGIRLKTPDQWRYIGKGMTSYDLTELCTGRAIYGEDIRVNSMVYASIEHPPVIGGKVTSVDDSEAVKVAGVHQTVPIDPFKPPPAFQPLGGIAVIADNTWAAFQGRKKLKIEWITDRTQPTILSSIRRSCRPLHVSRGKLYAT